MLVHSTRQDLRWKMPESRIQFAFKLLVLLSCFPFQNVSGITVKLTRDEDGDYFESPNKDLIFCPSMNAICSDKDGTAQPQQDECSHCKCKKDAATFNETHCMSFQDLQGGMVEKKLCENDC